MNDWLKTKLPGIDEILKRLLAIFPREIDSCGFIGREIGAKTVFVMLYSFCVDGDNWIRPASITCMTDEQASKVHVKERLDWLDLIQTRRNKAMDVIGRWYMPNTRECIRDETIRDMVRFNAVIERPGVSTTSPKPRYSLQKQFAGLFNPNLQDEELEKAINAWQVEFLSAKALARVALSKKMVSSKDDGILVTLPNKEVRKLSPGPSSELIKAVIERFTFNFMKDPAVILVSESANKIIHKDDALCKAIGFNIDVSTVLPDIILVELGEKHPIIVFVECVATDGPINDRRKQELISIATKARYEDTDYAFVTVFKDRAGSESRRLTHTIAWDTFVWYATEPNGIVALHKDGITKIAHIGDMFIFEGDNIYSS